MSEPLGSRDKAQRTRFFKWLDSGTRYHHEALAKWGHVYEWSVWDDLVCLGEIEGFMNGRVMDVRRPIFRRP